MASYNRVVLLGNVGKDPEVRYTQGGDAVVSVSLATSEKWKAKDGQKQERTEWHRLEAWGKTAEVVRDYVKKGDPLLVEGSIRYEEWEKDGQKRFTTKIRVSTVQLLGSRRDGTDRNGGEDRKPSQAAPVKDAFIDDEDVPF